MNYLSVGGLRTGSNVFLIGVTFFWAHLYVGQSCFVQVPAKVFFRTGVGKRFAIFLCEQSVDQKVTRVQSRDNWTKFRIHRIWRRWVQTLRYVCCMYLFFQLVLFCTMQYSVGPILHAEMGLRFKMSYNFLSIFCFVLSATRFFEILARFKRHRSRDSRVDREL